MKAKVKNLLKIFFVLAVIIAIIPAAVKAADTDPAVAGWNIVLRDNIGVNFYLSIPEADVADTTVSIIIEGKTNTLNVSDLNKSGDNYVCAVDLPAAQMTENIQVIITTGGTEKVNKSYSIYQYGKTILDGEYPQDTKNLVAHMLNYGAAAQNYFKYNTGNLATAGVSVPALKEVPNVNLTVAKQGSAAGVTFGGCSMIHLNRIGVRFYFNLEGNVADYTFSGGTIGYSDKNAMHYVQFLDICPQYFNDTTTVTVTNKSGESVSYTYSPMHYITRMYHKSTSTAELKNMVQALYNYHIAALEYMSEVSEATVYDIFDLTGNVHNTIKGTSENWDGQIRADVSAAHKENFAFKTKLTMDTQEIRLSLTAKDGDSHYDPVGYAVYLYGESGRVELRRNNSTLINAYVESLTGTHIFEAGAVDILMDGGRVGKHLYVKIDDVVVCEFDDYIGYLTGDSLGTKIIDFHYGAATQMDTTYTVDFGADHVNVYDVYKLTGQHTKIVNAWYSTKIGSIAAEHKEQASFNFDMNITNARHRYRFSVGAQEGVDCTDPRGYGLEIATQFDGQNHVKFTRGNGSQIAIFNDISSLIGAHNFEFGYRTVTVLDTLNGDVPQYKQVFLKVDGTDLYTYNDQVGYLTGDALGTMIAMHHIDDSAVVLNSLAVEYGQNTVYDIYDLTGSDENTIKGTGAGNWSTTVLGNIDAAHKEAAALKAKVTITDNARYRFSLGALASDDCVDPAGYGLEVEIGTSGRVTFIRGSSHTWIKSWSLDTTYLKGEHLLELGYRDIIFNGSVIGKQVYLSVDGNVGYSYNDFDGYLTGSALGTKTAIFHYGNSIQMNTTYDVIVEYGTPTVYDIYDLTGAMTNTIQGTDATWDGQIHANISAQHKENFAFKTKMTMGAQNVRLSLTAKDGDSIYDAPGYAVYLYGADNRIEIRRNNSVLKSATVSGLAGTYIFEVGIVDILTNGVRTGKHAYVKINDVVVCEYDDITGYLTGDALGTKIVDFHYGAAIRMDTTYSYSYGETKVYDISNLTGNSSNAINGTGNGNWSTTVLGNFNAADKENVALKTYVKFADAAKYRFSMGALESDDCVDPAGYGFELVIGEQGYIAFIRGSSHTWIKSWNADTRFLQGQELLMEFGYRDILFKGNVIGKQIYISVNGTVLYTYDDMSGYLTGGTLGTKVAMFHYGTTVEMNSAN